MNHSLPILGLVCALVFVGCGQKTQPAETDGSRTSVTEMVGDSILDAIEDFASDSLDMESDEDEEMPPQDSLFDKLVPQKVPASFSRYEQTFQAPFGREVEYSACVDFPKQTLPHYASVQTWLIGKIEEALDCYWDADFSGKVKRVEKPKRYKGNIYANRQIVQLYKDVFFKGIHQEYGDKADDYPLGLSHTLQMEAVMANERVVSFRSCIYNYYGGAHGMIVERLCSFDPVHREEVDWNYLFKPQDKNTILMLLADEAIRNEKFTYWEGYRIQQMDEKNRRRFLMDVVDKDDDSLMLPSVGLTQEGVVFSYQHYAFSCFAAGAFHFKLPYDVLTPYLTERGRWISENFK